ncbi:MAG: hypothetical protein Q9226_007131 [Calogaya cf. arnoldii]
MSVEKELCPNKAKRPEQDLQSLGNSASSTNVNNATTSVPQQARLMPDLVPCDGLYAAGELFQPSIGGGAAQLGRRMFYRLVKDKMVIIRISSLNNLHAKRESFQTFLLLTRVSKPKMKHTSLFAALSIPLLFSSVLARHGLDPDSIPMLTRTIDYTFHSICNDYQNPVPIPLFDELGLAKTIFGITNDLYSFMMGYSTPNDDANDDENVGNKRVIVSDHPSLRELLRGTKPHGSALLQSLVDEMMHSTRRSELLESQTSIAEGPVGDMIMEQARERERTVRRYALFPSVPYTGEIFDML